MEDRTARTECKNERKKAIISTNRCDLNDFELIFAGGSNPRIIKQSKIPSIYKIMNLNNP